MRPYVSTIPFMTGLLINGASCLPAAALEERTCSGCNINMVHHDNGTLEITKMILGKPRIMYSGPEPEAHENVYLMGYYAVVAASAQEADDLVAVLQANERAREASERANKTSVTTNHTA